MGGGDSRDAVSGPGGRRTASSDLAVRSEQKMRQRPSAVVAVAAASLQDKRDPLMRIQTLTMMMMVQMIRGSRTIHELGNERVTQVVERR